MADDNRRSRALKHSRDEHDSNNRRSDGFYNRDKRIRYDREDRLGQGNSNYSRSARDVNCDEEEGEDAIDNRASDLGETSQRDTSRLGSTIGAIRGRTHGRNDGNNQSFDDKDNMPDSSTLKVTLEERKSSLAKLNPDLAVRNRRMFGSLMGHLGLAKQKLEKDSNKINKQLEYEKSILQKKNEEMLRNSYAKQKEAKENFFKKQITAIQFNAQQRNTYLESLESFLFTITEPRLSWLPAHTNKTSKGLLSRRHDEIQKEIVEKDILDNQRITQLEEECEAAFKKLEDGLNSALEGNLVKKLSSADDGDQTVPDSKKVVQQDSLSRLVKNNADVEDGEEVSSPSKDSQAFDRNDDAEGNENEGSVEN